MQKTTSRHAIAGSAAVLAGAMLLAWSSILQAHDGASGVVKDRMDMMKDMGKAMKAMAPMMQGKADYQSFHVKEAARIIKEGSDHMPMMFPEGSEKAPSEASGNIWKDWTGFELNAKILSAYAAALEVNAGKASDASAGETRGSHGHMGASDHMPDGMPNPGHLAQMSPAALFAAIAKTCSECHKSYRVKKK